MGYFEITIKRANGSIEKHTVQNQVTNESRENLLRVVFLGDTHPTTGQWYLGLIAKTGFTALALTDTGASHSGWTEFTNYELSTRPQLASWNSTAGSGIAARQSRITDALKLQRPLGSLIKGWFIISLGTKGGFGGLLLAAGVYDAGDFGGLGALPIAKGDEFFPVYNYAMSTDATVES